MIAVAPVGAPVGGPAAAAADLAALHAQAFDDPWSAADIGLLLGSPGVFAFDGRIDGENAGFILCRIAADEAEVLTIAVAPASRRMGLARALLDAGSARAMAGGAQAVFLEVAIDNAPALGLYRQQGFTEVGRRPAYYHRPGEAAVAALVMRRDLNR